jgi:hypothetical protein
MIQVRNLVKAYGDFVAVKDGLDPGARHHEARKRFGIGLNVIAAALLGTGSFLFSRIQL